jgi:hypothetical protein
LSGPVSFLSLQDDRCVFRRPGIFQPQLIHMHLPPVQFSPPMQRAPHAPQLPLSVSKSEHVPAQLTSPAAHVHMPPAQIKLAPQI